MTGVDNVEGARSLHTVMIDSLCAGEFELRKWKSNHLDLDSNLPEDFLDKRILELGKNDTKKTLVVNWTPRTDNFKFKINLAVSQTTKRSILSQIARIYDPL